MKKKSVMLMLGVLLAAASVGVGGCGKDAAQTEDEESVSREELESEWDGTYTAEETITESTSYEKLQASYRKANQIGMLIDEGASVYCDSIKMDKVSAKSTLRNKANLYGIGAAILVKDGSIDIPTGSLETDASGATALYCLGNSNIKVTDTEITTQAAYSSGVQAVTEDGFAYAELEHVIIDTYGRESAGIKSMGSAAVSITDSYVKTEGKNAPAIAASGEVKGSEATFEATASESIRADGSFDLWMEDCTFTSNKKGSNANNFVWSMLFTDSDTEYTHAGDDEQDAYLINGAIESHRGGLFYVTNTYTHLYLSGVAISSASDADFLLRCSGNNNLWGEAGKNGGELYAEFSSEEVSGDLVVDAISEIELHIYNDTVWTGAVKCDNSFAGDAEGDGTVILSIVMGSKWVVTEDCAVDEIHSSGEIVDEDGNPVTIVDESGSVLVQGSGKVTVTTGMFEDAEKFGR